MFWICQSSQNAAYVARLRSNIEWFSILLRDALNNSPKCVLRSVTHQLFKNSVSCTVTCHFQNWYFFGFLLQRRPIFQDVCSESMCGPQNHYPSSGGHKGQSTATKLNPWNNQRGTWIQVRRPQLLFFFFFAFIPVTCSEMVVPLSFLLPCWILSSEQQHNAQKPRQRIPPEIEERQLEPSEYRFGPSV